MWKYEKYENVKIGAVLFISTFLTSSYFHIIDYCFTIAMFLMPAPLNRR